MTNTRIILAIIVLLFLVPIFLVIISGKVPLNADWQNASRISANIAPKPEKFPDAIVQIYAARTFSWRGWFAVHTWIATKEKNAQTYTVYQVIGWRKFWNLSPLSIETDIPDRYWFGQKPILLKSFSGEQAEKLIPKIAETAKAYPYKDKYTFWPGPNSNTFVAFVARSIPELELSMPPLAIGKDYLGKNKFIAKTPSSSGFQFSLFGLFGITISRDEGLEIDVLGLVLGVNPLKPSISLPAIGYLGF
jgi:hypothetical protein